MSTSAPARKPTPKPAPTPTPETARYWQAANEGRIELPVCDACDKYVFPPRPHCPCGGPATDWQPLSGTGRLLSYVISHRPAPGWADEVPYVIALVQLDEGVRLMSNLVGVEPDPAALRLDMPLAVEFEPRGEQMVPVFRPTEVAR